MNKKIFLSLFLVLIIAISASAVSAADDVASIDDAGIDDAILADGEGEGEDPTPTDDRTPDAIDIDNQINALPEEGGTITLGDREYDIGNATFTITKPVTIQGGENTVIKSTGTGPWTEFTDKKGNTYYDYASLTSFNLKGIGSQVKNIQFINNDGEKSYGEKVYGTAIQMSAANQIVDNCKFYWYNKGVIMQSAKQGTITNNYFTGSSTKVELNGNEEGSYGISVAKSSDVLIQGNIFEGQLLDGISAYQGSSNCKVYDNQFIGNVYAIFFGGASTPGSEIKGNTFTNCGVAYDAAGEIISTSFPVISTVKSGDGYSVTENTFNLMPNGLVLELNSGNTAHGAPTKIGNINITENTVNGDSGTFISLVSEGGEFAAYAPIVIANNVLADGIEAINVWYQEWGTPDNILIPAAEATATFINIKEANTAAKTITIELIDAFGEGITSTITYTINGGEEQSAETDEDGLLTINVPEDGIVTFAYAGNASRKASDNSINFQSVKTISPVATTITASAITATAKISKNLVLTLKDANGALANKKVKVSVNGKTTTVTTNAKGQATIKVNMTKAGTYYYSLCFLGDNDYKAAFKTVKVTVNKQATKAVFKAKTFKVKATKKISFTLKDSKGKVIAKKKITFKVNGKTYTATTNSKGVATATIKITKKGKYTATAKFAGDSTYKTISKKATITIK